MSQKLKQNLYTRSKNLKITQKPVFNKLSTCAKSVYKIPDGKLLRISLDYNDKNKKILGLLITGDFFVYPEEAIEILEKKLVNTTLNGKILKDKISNVIIENKIEFIGLNVEGLVTGIMMCLK